MSIAEKASDPSSEEAELQAIWKSVATKTIDAQTKALYGGANFRLNVAKAFSAAWKATSLYFKMKKAALLGGPGIEDVLGIGSDVVGLVTASLNAVREKLHPLAYVACFALSSAEQGIKSDTLKSRIEAFVRDCLANPRPWYASLPDKVVKEAANAMKDPDWFDTIVPLLRQQGWLEEKDGIMHFKPRDFVWGFADG